MRGRCSNPRSFSTLALQLVLYRRWRRGMSWEGESEEERDAHPERSHWARTRRPWPRFMACRCRKAWILKLFARGCRYATLGRWAVPRGNGRKGEHREGIESAYLNILYSTILVGSGSATAWALRARTAKPSAVMTFMSKKRGVQDLVLDFDAWVSEVFTMKMKQWAARSLTYFYIPISRTGKYGTAILPVQGIILDELKHAHLSQVTNIYLSSYLIERQSGRKYQVTHISISTLPDSR